MIVIKNYIFLQFKVLENKILIPGRLFQIIFRSNFCSQQRRNENDVENGVGVAFPLSVKVLTREAFPRNVSRRQQLVTLLSLLYLRYVAKVPGDSCLFFPPQQEGCNDQETILECNVNCSITSLIVNSSNLHTITT